jgi:NADH-quinone oxidoreductase subunit G/NADP-reducing hydrogenase subunit HndD
MTIVDIKINGFHCQVDTDWTLLRACNEYGYKIPTLCYLAGLNEEGACSLCLVELKGAKNLVRSCVTKVTANMEVITNSPRVLEARRTIFELIMANHDRECLSCERNQQCELQDIANELGITDIFYAPTRPKLPLDKTSVSIIRDPNKCILCHRCVSVCLKIQSVNAIAFNNRGINTIVSTYLNNGLGNSECVNCGQCILACPTGALSEKKESDEVWAALADQSKFVVVQTAPAVRAAIGEEFGLEPGTLVTGKMTAALRRLGFDKVFDTQFSADLTIMEEAHELLYRIKDRKPLPLITSCSPGWIKFAEQFYPKILSHVSTCKSPQQMFGAIAKTYYAEKIGIDPRKIVVVSIMPCTAKKYEAQRPEMQSAYEYWKEKKNYGEQDKFRDVDYVLTTREAARMIKQAGLDFGSLPNEPFDDPLGSSTGAASLFGATGGVMEAALRTAYEALTGNPLLKLEFDSVRGLAGIKSADIDINGKILKVAVANGLANARKLLEEVQAGISPYQFIEIMCCPGGCIGGGGQPLPTNFEIRQKRADALYRADEGMPLRKSHENPEIQTLYSEFLKQPLAELSHCLLHTKYEKRA